MAENTSNTTPNTNSPNTTPNPTDSTTTNMEIRRTISPYDLTAADNPGAVISHPLLRGDNYDEWACGLKTALSSRKKFGFLDGSIKKPEAGSSDLDDWWTIQALLVSWLKMTIEPGLRSTISHRDVAKDLWDHLKKRFAVTNGPRFQQLKSDLVNCRQRGVTIEAYFGKLTRIWDQMANFQPLRVCRCGKCDCDLGVLQERDREDGKIHEFLCGLDDTYRTVKSTIVSRVPLPSLEEVYNLIRQDEDLKVAVRLHEEINDVSAYAVQTKFSSGQLKTDDHGKSPLCKHCQRAGHSSDSCFAVIGYPEWWGERPRSRTSHGRGRGKQNVTEKSRPTFANAVHTSSPSFPVTQANYVVTEKDRDGVQGLNDSQWRKLVALLNTGPSSSSIDVDKLSGPRFEDADWSG